MIFGYRPNYYFHPKSLFITLINLFWQRTTLKVSIGLKCTRYVLDHLCKLFIKVEDYVCNNQAFITKITIIMGLFVLVYLLYFC